MRYPRTHPHPGQAPGRKALRGAQASAGTPEQYRQYHWQEWNEDERMGRTGRGRRRREKRGLEVKWPKMTERSKSKSFLSLVS